MWGVARAAQQEANALQYIGTQADASHPSGVSILSVSTISSDGAGVRAPGVAGYPTCITGGASSVPRLLPAAPPAAEWCDQQSSCFTEVITSSHSKPKLVRFIVMWLLQRLMRGHSRAHHDKSLHPHEVWCELMLQLAEPVIPHVGGYQPQRASVTSGTALSSVALARSAQVWPSGWRSPAAHPYIWRHAAADRRHTSRQPCIPQRSCQRQ